jgi:hypothetical protein
MLQIYYTKGDGRKGNVLNFNHKKKKKSSSLAMPRDELAGFRSEGTEFS